MLQSYMGPITITVDSSASEPYYMIQAFSCYRWVPMRKGYTNSHLYACAIGDCLRLGIIDWPPAPKDDDTIRRIVTRHFLRDLAPVPPLTA